jgi:hypothetical protein
LFGVAGRLKRSLQISDSIATQDVSALKRIGASFLTCLLYGVACYPTVGATAPVQSLTFFTCHITGEIIFRVFRNYITRNSE